MVYRICPLIMASAIGCLVGLLAVKGL